MTTITEDSLFSGELPYVVIFVNKAGSGIHSIWERIDRVHHDITKESEIQGILDLYRNGEGFLIDRDFWHTFSKVFCVCVTDTEGKITQGEIFKGLRWLKGVLPKRDIKEVAIPLIPEYDADKLAEELDNIGISACFYNVTPRVMPKE